MNLLPNTSSWPSCLYRFLSPYNSGTRILSFWFLFLAYSVGATANHNLHLATHEITHNLAFKGVDANKALAVFANLPATIPYAFSFKVCRALYYIHILAHLIAERDITWSITNISV